MTRQGQDCHTGCAQQAQWSGQVILSGPQMCTTPRDNEGLGPPFMGHNSCSQETPALPVEFLFTPRPPADI